MASTEALEDEEVLASARRGPSIGTQVGRGLRWSIVGLLITKMASFAISLILARLLTPNDFGLFAIAMSMTAFLIHVNDAGVIAAVVQWRGRIEEMSTTATALAFTFSLSVYAGLWFVAPAFAHLTSSPHATPIIRLLALVIVLDGITAVRSGALMRRFQQDKLTLANLAGFALQAPLSIILALHGAGAYSFAVGQVAGATVTAIIVLTFGRVHSEAGFDRVVVKRLLRFGLPLAASLGIEAILVNADYVIVGRLLGVTALGFYLLAFNVSSWVPGIITTGVRYVSVAGFSRLAEKETSSLAKGVYQSAPALVALVLPIAVLMSILSTQVVAFLFGSQWGPSAPVLRFLMVLMVARVVVSFIFDILTSAGATTSTLWLNLAWAVVLIPALWFGTRHDGIRGTAISHAIVGTVVAVPFAIFMLERAGVRLGPILPVLARLFFAATLCGLACVGLRSVLPSSTPWLQLLVAGGGGLLVYLGVAIPAPGWERIWVRAGGSKRPTPQPGRHRPGRHRKV
jgi:O-antigen/teichoic acid export membrane protein